MKLRTLKEIKEFKGKRALVRVDFNVPVENGRVLDDFKIIKGLPVVAYLLGKGAKVILVSHLGRPKGADKKLSLAPIAKKLSFLLKQNVPLLKNDFKAAEEHVKRMKDGEACILENIRFFSGEEKGDEKLAKQLSALADFFVLDGFAVAHRRAASVDGVAEFLPAYAGPLLAGEIDALSKATDNPHHPFVVILGGIKTETKLPLLHNFLKKAGKILLGGGIVNTYLWARGEKVGSSLVEKKLKKEVLDLAKNKKILWPVDVVTGKPDGKEARVVNLSEKLNLKTGFCIYDIGPKTIRLFAEQIKEANTLIWNGAMGHFEKHPYEYGTYAVARLLASRSKGKAYGVAGGGETVEVLRHLNLTEEIDFISTGGGAMLEFLSGEKLPGLKAL